MRNACLLCVVHGMCRVGRGAYWGAPGCNRGWAGLTAARLTQRAGQRSDSCAVLDAYSATRKGCGASGRHFPWSPGQCAWPSLFGVLTGQLCCSRRWHNRDVTMDADSGMPWPRLLCCSFWPAGASGVREIARRRSNCRQGNALAVDLALTSGRHVRPSIAARTEPLHKSGVPAVKLDCARRQSAGMALVEVWRHCDAVPWVTKVGGALYEVLWDCAIGPAG